MSSRASNRRCHRQLAAGLGILGAALAAFLASGEVTAQTASRNGYQGFGPVLGVGVDPDQVHLGLRFDMGEISNRLDLRPGFEAGVGDGITRGSFMVDALYRFRRKWDVWQPYAGGGISLAVMGREGIRLTQFGWVEETHVEAEPGLNMIGGVAKGVGRTSLLQVEVRLGIGEAPDLGLSVGWLFR